MSWSVTDARKGKQLADWFGGPRGGVTIDVEAQV